MRLRGGGREGGAGKLLGVGCRWSCQDGGEGAGQRPAQSRGPHLCLCLAVATSQFSIPGPGGVRPHLLPSGSCLPWELGSEPQSLPSASSPPPPPLSQIQRPQIRCWGLLVGAGDGLWFQWHHQKLLCDLGKFLDFSGHHCPSW